MTDLRVQVSRTADLGVFAAVVVLGGRWMVWLGAAVTAALALVLLNGFVVDEYTFLRQHSGADTVRLVLLGCAGGGAAARALRLLHGRWAGGARFICELAQIAGTTSPTRERLRHA